MATIRIRMDIDIHEFEKKNEEPEKDKRGKHDIYTCRLCGITGKRYVLAMGMPVLYLHGNTSKKKIANCDGREIEKPDKWIGGEITILTMTTGGRAFENLTEGSTHEIIAPPRHAQARFPNGRNDSFWVMGNGEPVRVLKYEIESKKMPDQL